MSIVYRDAVSIFTCVRSACMVSVLSAKPTWDVGIHSVLGCTKSKRAAEFSVFSIVLDLLWQTYKFTMLNIRSQRLGAVILPHLISRLIYSSTLERRSKAFTLTKRGSPRSRYPRFRTHVACNIAVATLLFLFSHET